MAGPARATAIFSLPKPPIAPRSVPASAGAAFSKAAATATQKRKNAIGFPWPVDFFAASCAGFVKQGFHSREIPASPAGLASRCERHRLPQRSVVVLDAADAFAHRPQMERVVRRRP